MKISCLTTGRVRQKLGERGIRRYVLSEWRDETLPVNVFVVRHPAGICLVDAGQTAEAAEPGYFARWYPFFRLSRFELDRDDEADVQLAASGVAADAVRWVILSHLHTDHVGGIAAFSHAEVLVSRREWTRAQGIAGRLRGYLPQRWPTQIRPTLVDFDGPPLGPFASTHALAEDGTLVLVPLPGHTAGHTGLLVRGDDRAYLCIGDAANRAADLRAIAPGIARWCDDERIAVLASHDDAARAVLTTEGEA
jgi:N-acyl homoserine lactone hydrolase